MTGISAVRLSTRRVASTQSGPLRKAAVPWKLYRAINAEASPYRYSVDPKDLLRIHKEVDANDWDFLVIYHSHTHTEAYPSPTDIRLAAWPEAYYALVSLMDEEHPRVRAFRIVDGQVSEEELQVA